MQRDLAMSFALARVSAALLLGACADTVASAPESVALTGLTLIDGSDAPARGPVTILIERGVISHIAADGAVSVPSGTRIIDLHGMWAVPGFIDVHTHMPASDQQPAVLRLLLAHGITTARSPASFPGTGVELRQRLARGDLTGPRFLTAGRLIDAPGSIWPTAASVRTAAEMRAEIARQAVEDVDFIKIYSRIPPELVDAAIQEAHARGLQVIGHLGRTTWLEAAKSGIDALTHSFVYGFAHSAVPASHAATFAEFFQPNPAFDASLWDDWQAAMDFTAPRFDSLVTLLANRRITIDPNLVLAEAVAWGDDRNVFNRLETHRDVIPHAFPHPYSSSWTASDRNAARAAFPTLLEAIRVMHQRGVILTAGTDLQNPWMTPGVSFHRELELLVQAGLSPADVLRIATRNGAVSLGLEEVTGTLEVAKAADIVVIKADPQVNISNTRAIELVVARGRVFYPAQLLNNR